MRASAELHTKITAMAGKHAVSSRTFSPAVTDFFLHSLDLYRAGSKTISFPMHETIIP